MISDALGRLIEGALTEDSPWGDITSEVFLPATARASAALVPRESGTLSGIEVFRRVFDYVDPEITTHIRANDGDSLGVGVELARVEGRARSLLQAERVALNLVQRMSGIATQTALFVEAVAGTGVRIVDTRKTTPGLRFLERQAVRDGGGHNHRFSLSDAVLAKDNHLAVLAAAGVSIGEAISSARARLGHTTHLEVEVDRVEQIEEVVAAGVDSILLDNFSLDQLREGVGIVAGRAIVEASGGVSLESVTAIASTGIDQIAVGALTHSTRAIDLGLDIAVA